MRNRSLWVVGISCLLLYGCSDDSSGVSASGRGTPEPVVGEAECGNRIVETGEICDDGNTVSNDGCSADCKSVEEGYECSKTGGSCTKINKPQPDKCGNQLLDENEACDDGNTTGGDGCSADCSTVEDNYICNRVGRPCIPAGCGNSVTDGNEECDDGPESNVEYTQQNLSLCNPECQWAHYCGDNKLDAVDIANGEECDNGGIDTSNERNGCSADCKRVNYCGDGIVDKTAGEDCDDDNNTSGDGCSDACNIETGFSCIVEHGKSVCSPIACGNGVLDADKGESCDDHNRLSNDGCAANCQIETGYRCTQNGEGLSVCENTCGNGIVDADVGETCDDGKSIAGDGCSDKCRVEPGYICPEQGKPCFARACGDGLLAGNEECDDGNDVSGDGCSKQCRRESGFVCREPNKPCVHTECGDSKVEGDETCDEGKDTTPSGGCVDCQIQMGWQCLTPGSACTHDATCGNGVLEGAEECDEGSDEANHTAGCVGCIITNGWRCPAAGSKCIEGSCGDKNLDKGEACDDGNSFAGDGCSPDCRVESIFVCTDKSCLPRCGDGLTLVESNEECDDGNLVNGDGCSSDCKVESGFTCTAPDPHEEPEVLNLPIIYRDFRAYHFGNTGHGDHGSYSSPHPGYPGFFSEDEFKKLPDACKVDSGYRFRHFPVAGSPLPDFNGNGCYGNNRCSNVIYPELSSEGRPVLRPASEMTRSPMANSNFDGYEECKNLYTCPEVFDYWYKDSNMSVTIKSTLPLKRKVDNGKTKYHFLYTENGYTASNFWPLDGKGFNAANAESLYGYKEAAHGLFTTEFQSYFKYSGGETLTFAGDDDVWVFFNGHLALEFAGIHGNWQQSITLTEEVAKKYGMYPGGIYSLQMFHAERCQGGSTFELSLTGFVNMGTSECTSICGDGIVRGDEECDPVVFANPAAPTAAELEQAKSAGCVSCKVQAFCGNGKVEKGEHCDTTEDWCQNCKIPTCGNGVVDAHERCDGRAGVTGDQVCLDNCQISGCGDGIVDEISGEECDDFNAVDDDNCTNACKRPVCGDKVVQSWLGEVCDDGVNDGSYNGCGFGCSYLPPRCGDGIVDKSDGESCDDGTNDGTYGTCNPDCTLPAHCGDKIIQEEFESCDDGEENGQPGKCGADCRKSVN